MPASTSASGPSAIHPERHRRLALLVVGLLSIGHLTGVLLLFAPFQGAFDHNPLIDQDWGPLFHHLTSMAAFWRDEGRLWGYNPLFMAGYPSNTIQDLSVKFFEIAAQCWTMLGLGLVQGVKLTFLITVAVVPWLCAWSARHWRPLVGNPDRLAIIASVLGTVYWWNSYPREMAFYGMVGFPAACYVALFNISILPTLASRDGWRVARHTAWIASMAILPALHLEGFVLVALVAVVAVIACDRSERLRLIMAIAVGAVVALAVNWIWLGPALAHLGDGRATALANEVPLFQNTSPWTFIGDYIEPGGYFTFRASIWANGLRLALLVAGVGGAVRLLRSGDRRLAAPLISAIGGMFLLTYFGSLVPHVATLQPLRFKIALDLVLVITAAHAWYTSRALRYVLIAGLITAAVNIGLTEGRRAMPLRTVLKPAMAKTVEWIRTTPQNGRVLFEESGDETGFVYDGMYLSSFLPHWTGRTLIGGPISVYNDRHHVAEFHSGVLFKHSVASLSHSRIAAYLRAYNIGAIVAFHPDSVRQLTGITEMPIRLAGRMGPYHFMRVEQPLTWFLEGEGRDVEVRLGRLRVVGARGEAVVLKHHWVEGLIATPAAEIVPHRVLDDPIPFIKVLRPPSDFTISLSGRRPASARDPG